MILNKNIEKMAWSTLRWGTKVVIIVDDDAHDQDHVHDESHDHVHESHCEHGLSICTVISIDEEDVG